MFICRKNLYMNNGPISFTNIRWDISICLLFVSFLPVLAIFKGTTSFERVSKSTVALIVHVSQLHINCMVFSMLHHLNMYTIFCRKLQPAVNNGLEIYCKIFLSRVITSFYFLSKFKLFNYSV